MLKAVYIVLGLNALVAVVLWSLGETGWLLNGEVGFFIASIIIFNSYKSYAKLVQTSVENGVAMNYDDVYDKLDDPHDLYDDEDKEETPTQKERLKETLSQTKKALPGSFSLRRILSYALLALAFVSLQNNHALDVGALLAGITGGIIASVWIGRKTLLRH